MYYKQGTECLTVHRTFREEEMFDNSASEAAQIRPCIRFFRPVSLAASQPVDRELWYKAPITPTWIIR